MALLEEGNPATEAPEAAWSGFDASTYLAGLEQRSKRVVQLETKPSQSRRTGPAIAWVLAAAAVIVVGAIILTSNDPDDLPPADQPTTTSTVAPTTTSTTPATTTTVPVPRDQATAEAMMAGLYQPGGAALAALPWANPTVGENIVWVSEFGVSAHAEHLEYSCVPAQVTVTCTSNSKDDVSRAVDPAAVYSDEFTLAFNGPTGLIVDADWKMNTTGRLDEFFTWTQENASEIYDRGNVCDLAAGQPAECATALLGLVADFEEAVGS
jgi:hypothetical protein